MAKPIEVEHRQRWHELRKAVFYQPADSCVTYEIVGSLRSAAASVRHLARKYEFKVTTIIDLPNKSLVVYKESEPINGNTQS